MGFEDSEHFKTWARFRDAAHKEKEWMNQRLVWVLASQAFLFAAFVAVHGFGTLNPDYLSHGDASAPSLIADKTAALWVAAVGAFTSLMGFLGLYAAGRMHWHWSKNMNLIVDYLNKEDAVHYAGVLTFGSRPRIPSLLSSILPGIYSYLFYALWSYNFIHLVGLRPFWSYFVAFVVALFIVLLHTASFILDRRRGHPKIKFWHSDVVYKWPNELNNSQNFDDNTSDIT